MPQLPVYSSTDFLWQFQRLLPRGRVWHRGWGTLQAQALLTLMPTWARLHLRLNDLISQIFPCSTTELLTEWEQTLGLPDPCTGPLDTIQQRQGAVCSKFCSRGGQSKQYFIDLAAAAGFAISIKEFAPFRASINRAGDPVRGQDWAFAWEITTQATTIVYFRASLSTAGEPLATWGNKTLECLIERYAPAHTVIIWRYVQEGGGSVWDRGESIYDQGASLWDGLNG
jgi:uncharacterized protein YmfQ (DUF2313 family)